MAELSAGDADGGLAGQAAGFVGRDGDGGQAAATRCRVEQAPHATGDRSRIGRVVRTNRCNRGRTHAGEDVVELDAVDDAVGAAGLAAGVDADAVRSERACCAVRGLVGGVVREAGVLGLQGVLLFVFGADVEVITIAAEIALAPHTGDGGRACAVVLLRSADRGLGGEALEVLLSDDVDNAGDGVGAVGRRCAVLQDLDAFDGGVGNGVQVDEVTRRVVGQRIVGHTHAVDEDQGRVRRQAAQRNAGGAGCEVTASGPVVVHGAAVIAGNVLNGAFDRRHAALFEVGRSDHRQRRDRLQVLLAQDRAGDDDGLVVRRSSCWRRGGRLRHGEGGQQRCCEHRSANCCRGHQARSQR